MQQTITLKLKPSEAIDDSAIKSFIATTIGKPTQQVTGFYLLKKSIDARSKKQVWINLTVHAFINEPF
ncbi:hypothetical protein ABTN71_20005, partial [Acinetobacter baumannii]